MGVPRGNSFMQCATALVAWAAFVFVMPMIDVRADDPDPAAKAPGSVEKEKKEKASQPKITVSKETTFIDGPLSDQGYVNYIEALHQQYSKGVTPKNNAAVAMALAMGPNCGEMGSMTVEYKKEFYKRLGIEMPAEKGDYLVTLSELAPLMDIDINQVNHEQELSTRGPFTKKDLPTMARWIEVNEKPLAVITAGMKRSRWYMPLVADAGDTMILTLLMPNVYSARSVGRLLNARAMNRLSAGDVEGAWQDLMTIHRLARHVAQGTRLIERLVGLALDGIACHGDRIIAQSGQVMTPQALGFRDQLEQLSPIPRMADSINIGERYMFLDACTHLARDTAGVKEFISIEYDGSLSSTLTGLLAKRLIDWDEPMKIGNQWYDKLVEAARKPSYLEKKEALDVIDAELKKLAERAANVKAFMLKLLLAGSRRRVVGRQVGAVLVSLFLPVTIATIDAEARADLDLDMTRITLALTAFHIDHGRFPESLDKLAPKYIAELPRDPFVERPLKYSLTPDGYLMYSVGANQVDDAGNGWWEDRQDGDDLAVRFPRAKKVEE